MPTLPPNQPTIEDDLRTMVVRLEAYAQMCGSGAGPFARAVTYNLVAASLRDLLEQYGHECVPCVTYDNPSDALAAVERSLWV